MTRRKTEEEFEKEIYNLVGDEYTVLGDYINNRTPISMIHNECNKKINPTPSSFVRGNRCPHCYGNIKKDTAKFKKEVFELVNNEYEVLGEYKNNRTKIKMKHNTCSFEYMVKPYHFLISKTRCPQCFGKAKKSNAEFLSEIYNIAKDSYGVLDEYINYNSKIRFIHKDNNCNHIFKVSPAHFISCNQRCPKCEGSMRYNTESYKKEVKKTTKDEYECLDEYVNYTTHILHIHNKCGHEWVTMPSNFLKGFRCPRCNESKGERKIREWLTDKNINFSEQYAFDDCKNKRKLPFDFAIFSKNDELRFLIEYDGRQHFNMEDFYGGEEKFIQTKKHDQIKNNYCLNNNIKLIRIPHWDYENIESILNDFF